MGFFIMIFSAIGGVFLIGSGISCIKNKKRKIWSILSLSAGILLVLFAIWLGLPK